MSPSYIEEYSKLYTYIGFLESLQRLGLTSLVVQRPIVKYF